jgi:DNA-directed RNA polymerase specialized sigma24 family protein
MLQAVARAVGRLPVKQRAALVARRFRSQLQEIGVSLGCTAESARANVYQAVRKLRDWLEQP